MNLLIEEQPKMKQSGHIKFEPDNYKLFWISEYIENLEKLKPLGCEYRVLQNFGFIRYSMFMENADTYPKYLKKSNSSNKPYLVPRKGLEQVIDMAYLGKAYNNDGFLLTFFATSNRITDESHLLIIDYTTFSVRWYEISAKIFDKITLGKCHEVH